MSRLRVRRAVVATVLLAPFFFFPSGASAQATIADYQRAIGLRDRYQGLAVGVPEAPTWIGRSPRFWFRRSVKGGNEFVLVNPDTKTMAPPFDHARLATALSTATNKYTAATLPFNNFTFTDNERAIQFTIGPGGGTVGGGGAGRGGRGGPAVDPTTLWKCSLESYTCTPPSAGRGGGRGGRGGGGGLTGPVRAPFEINAAEPRRSPDGKLEALVNNYNVAIRTVGSREIKSLSADGSEGGYYDPLSIVWSPDSSKLAVYKVTPGYRRYVHYVESSPEDQLQPKDSVFQYAKPGDVLDVERPHVFDVKTGTSQAVDPALFPNAYDMSPLAWRADSSAFTFEYNQRGHQVFRVIEVNAATAKARAVISEEPKTFFCYSGKKYRADVADGKEIVWMSERDGWNHLYLYDGATGAVKNQITKGDWAVRNVVRVDDEARQIVFSAGGMYPGKDPYFVHYYRINFDGTGLLPLTTADANHAVNFSPDRQFYVDTYSRVDLPTVSELRKTADASLVMELQKADITELVKAGWKAPEAFVASTALSSARRISTRRKSIPSSRTSTPGRTARSCPRRSAPSTRCRPRPRSASSSCRSTAWGPTTGRRRFTTSRGRTSRMPGSRIASCGTRRSPRNIPTTTSRAWASTARRPAARTRSGRCSSSPSSTRRRCRRRAATTTGWTRSGGTRRGWDGRSASTTRSRPTSTTPTGCRARSCWSSARWIRTSIPRQRCRS
jgi:hypothetical protein